MSPEHSLEYSAQVVVYDDHHDLRKMLAMVLETAGFSVAEAATELELHRDLARRRPDAVIIDLQRYEADGLKALLRMRERTSLRDVPILFLAGSDAEDFRREAIDAGADWFGLRPVGMLDLQNRVEQLIRDGRAAPADSTPRPAPLQLTG
jgi:DNA-binding response OmpR family regulator